MTTSDAPTPKREATSPIPTAPAKQLHYRAIGLLSGRYIPRDEITQGILLTTDGTVVEAVVLGRVLGLVKSRIDLEKEHLWVVYPRTREDEPLHVQLAGIWEPETLHPDTSAPTQSHKPDYFSVMGEVVFQNLEEGWVMVKILQKPRDSSEKPTYFKLKLFGEMPEKPVKNFWNLHVQREGNNLIIKESERVAYLGKKKPKKKPKNKKPKRSADAQKQPTPEESPLESPLPKKPQQGSGKPTQKSQKD